MHVSIHLKAKSNVDIVDGPYTLSLMNTTELGSIVIGELRAGLTYEFLVRHAAH